jgi:hypothetical protein
LCSRGQAVGTSPSRGPWSTILVPRGPARQDSTVPWHRRHDSCAPGATRPFRQVFSSAKHQVATDVEKPGWPLGHDSCAPRAKKAPKAAEKTRCPPAASAFCACPTPLEGTRGCQRLGDEAALKEKTAALQAVYLPSGPYRPRQNAPRQLQSASKKGIPTWGQSTGVWAPSSIFCFYQSVRGLYRHVCWSGELPKKFSYVRSSLGTI